MKKIKVLQFPIANSKGGITQYVLQNWKFIDKSKFHFDFATMSKTLDFADRLEQEGCRIHYISCYAEENKQKFVNEFKKILSEEKYDIVHLHTKQWKSFLVEEIAREVGVKKIIVHAHNTGIDVIDEQKREKELQMHNCMLEKMEENIATDYWACSWKAADFIFGNKIPREKIIIMNNAIDLSTFTYNPKVREKYRKKLGLEDAYVIGNVGRFAYQKNQEFLLNVFGELCKNQDNNKNYKLLLIGSGERERKYIDIIQRWKLEEKVIFAGQRSDVAEMLQAMDLFCFPSRFEGFGISFIEAQATGLPCIISAHLPEESILTDNVVVLALNIQLWKEKILELSQEAYVRQSEEIELVNSGFDIKIQIREVEKRYIQNR